MSFHWQVSGGVPKRRQVYEAATQAGAKNSVNAYPALPTLMEINAF
jgi:hypothetical protein